MQIDGVFDRYVYVDDSTDFVSLRIRTERSKYAVMESRKCAVPSDLPVGTPMSFVCEPKEGPSFKYSAEKHYVFTDFQITGAASTQAAVDYLLGMEIKGIKAMTARSIVGVTGNDIARYFSRVTADEDLKRAIPRLSKATIAAIRARLPYKSAVNDFYKRVAEYGITFNQARAMYRLIMRGEDKNITIDVLSKVSAASTREYDEVKKKSIYDFARDASVNFSNTDALAQSLGYRAYNPHRIRAFVHAVMDYIYKQGSTWASLDQIYAKMRALVPKTAYPQTLISIHAIYATVAGDNKTYRVEGNGKHIALLKVWRDEKSVAFHTNRLKHHFHGLNYEEDIADKISAETGITYSESQARCFGFLRKSGIKIITGNAGTGKTTVISSILKAYRHLNPRGQVALCAPTGRAAQRMTELCKAYGGSEGNIRACTIHKLLGFLPYGDEVRTEYNATNPLPADIVIVDEMSMVDIHLFALLTKAIKEDALLILCGDVDQLPSVGAGKVFRDLIDSERFETVRLDVNYRQSNDKGLIVKNANLINNGDANITSGPGFEIEYCDTEQEMQKRVISIISADRNNTVLSTVRKGPAGVEELNAKLQPMVNKCTEDGWKVGNQTYKKGDVVLMNKNNYKVGYVNGDIGVVLAARSGHIVVQLGDDRKDLSGESLLDMSLAYAMTIHKAQGSEFDSVVIVLPTSAPHMLVRNLLYTAITRAKKHVTIISQKGAIESAVTKVSDSGRQTALKQMYEEEPQNV